MTVLHILAYASVTVFIVAVAVRAIRLATTPVHLRWELYPVAHEKDKVSYGGSYFEEKDWWTKSQKKSLFGELKVMVPEILLLKGVWEHNKPLWLWSFPMHFGLYLVIGFAALVLVTAFTGTQDGLGAVLEQIGWAVGLVGYVLGTVGALGLFGYRLFSRKTRGFTPPSAYLNILFLLALFATGLFVFATVDNPSGELAAFGRDVFTLGAEADPAGPVAAHLGVALLFMLYLPFTHMTHFFTKYFTYHSVRWNDEPNHPGSKLEAAIQRQLAYPVSWSAKHLRADGKKNWADIATDTEVE